MADERMRVIEIARPGGPEVLTPAMRSRPEPGAGEVLIAVKAAGVNRPDVIQRMGHYPPPPGASDLPGLEVAGVVAAVGEGVQGVGVGARVCALLAGGGYAEFALAPQQQVLPIPEGLGFEAAASLPETAFTVWTNIFDRGRFKAGESVLVHGGTSGIGVMAIQLVTALGGRVFATAGSPEKARACEALGAVRGIDYRAEDFVTVVREATEGRGVDLVLDMVAGDYLIRNQQACAVEGRIVMIAMLQGGRPPVDIMTLMAKRLTLTGSTLRARTSDQKGEIRDALLARVWPLIAAGRIKPVVHATFPLDQAADAHRLMESSAHVGKIVLTL